MLELCRAHDLDVPRELDTSDQLTPYAVHMRYGTTRPGDLDRDEAVRWARAAVDWARSLIESDGV